MHTNNIQSSDDRYVIVYIEDITPTAFKSNIHVATYPDFWEAWKEYCKLKKSCESKSGRHTIILRNRMKKYSRIALWEK
jgi:NADPH-dependent 7-cyano-7-deazaguanine reductase QueF